MPIKVTCDSCFVDLKVADQHAGKKIKCKECGEPITVPLPQRKVRVSAPSDADDALSNLDVEDAADEAEDLPTPQRGKASKKKRKRPSANWYAPENLIRNPLVIVLGIELLTAIPGFFSMPAAMLFALIWLVTSIPILMCTMVGGIFVVVILNPTAMASGLVMGNTATRHLIERGHIQVQEKSPAYDFIVKTAIASGSIAAWGILLLLAQMFVNIPRN